MAAGRSRMENVYLVVGLGNPGREYVRTRHNAGFMVVERLAERARAGWAEQKKFCARLARVERTDARVWLCQPLTFMNRSGEAVRAVADYYQVPLERLLVSVDEADLPLGEIRLRPSGGSAGHHGLESLREHLGTNEFARQRIGIGRESPDARAITDYVLAPFRPEETPVLERVLQRATEQIECWLESGSPAAMNRYNGNVNDPEQNKGKTE